MPRFISSLSKWLALFLGRREIIGDSLGEGRAAKDRQFVGGGSAHFGINITISQHNGQNVFTTKRLPQPQRTTWHHQKYTQKKNFSKQSSTPITKLAILSSLRSSYSVQKPHTTRCHELEEARLPGKRTSGQSTMNYEGKKDT